MIFVSPHRLEATFNILDKAVPPKDTWFYIVLVLPWTLDSICKKIKGGRKRCMFQTVGPADAPGTDRGFNLDLLAAFLEGGLWERGFSHLNFLRVAQCWTQSLKTCLKKWELVDEKKEKCTGVSYLRGFVFHLCPLLPSRPSPWFWKDHGHRELFLFTIQLFCGTLK